MNVLEHTVVEILEGPTQVVSDEECCWRVKAVVECYGHKDTRVFRFTARSAADRIQPGHTFVE